MSELDRLAAIDQPDVLLQVAVAAAKIRPDDPLPLLLKVLSNCGEDPLIPQIVWQNVHPRLDQQAQEFVELIHRNEPMLSINVKRLLPRIIDRLLAGKPADFASIASLLESLDVTDPSQQSIVGDSWEALAIRVINHEITGGEIGQLSRAFAPQLESIRRRSPSEDLLRRACVLAAVVGDETAATELIAWLRRDSNESPLELLARARWFIWTKTACSISLGVCSNTELPKTRTFVANQSRSWPA